MNELMISEQNGQAVVSSRQIADNFEKEHKHVLDSIRDILGSAEKSATPMFYETTYVHPQNKQSYPEYLMNRDGFTLLAMGFTGKEAMEWKIRYIQAFNEMERKLSKPMSQLEVLAQAAQALVEHDKQLKSISERQDKQFQELQGMRDIISLSPNDWRKDVTALLNKMAMTLGGYDHLQFLKSESYKLLDERMGVDVKLRLVNKRRRMAENGVCKSTRDKLNNLDVIGEDKKLIEGYLAIVKEMAIKYGVAA